MQITWESFNLYNQDTRGVRFKFEDLCRQIFINEFMANNKRHKYLHSNSNNHGIECEPIYDEKNQRWIGFQAKYFDNQVDYKQIMHSAKETIKYYTGAEGIIHAMNDRVDKLVSGEEPLPAKMGVAFADLNGLKTVNDDEGHDAGDKLLTRAASLLKLAFGDYEIYRAGGDEFVIVCPDISEEKLGEMVQQLRTMADSTPDVSFAVGTAYLTGDYSIIKAMQNADECMYKDKEEYYRLHPEKDRRKRCRV